MLRKTISVLVLVAFMLTTITAVFAASPDMTMLDKTAAVEKVLYGTIQTGSLVERISKIEKDVFGRDTKETLIDKLDKLYTYIIETSVSAPSLVTKLNAVEWTLNRMVTSQPAKPRIEGVERTLLGNAAPGSFDERVSKMLKLSYPGDVPEVMNAIVAKDTLVKIKMLTPLSSKQSRPGDIVSFQAAADVYAGGLLVVAQGATGSGKVTKVEPSKNFGRDAKLEISFDTIEAVDGTIISTVLGDKAKEETKSLAKAAGATVAGLVILGPIGVVGGAFVHGQDAVIPAGSELFIQTSADSDVFGIKVK